MAGSRPKIAYIVSRFPKLTETFVVNEALAMAQLGVDVDLYPLFPSREPLVNPETEALARRVHCYGLVCGRVLRAHAYYIRHRTTPYSRALAEIARATFGSLNFFLGGMAAFIKAVWFAYEMRADNLAHVHAQFANHPAVAALVVHRLTGIPFSFTARGSDIHLDRHMLKEKVAAATFAIAVCESNKRIMVEECGDQVGHKVQVIYGGVDLEKIEPQRMRRNTGSFQIVCVGRFEEIKGHRILIEACRLLRQRGLDFECHLLGDGELRPEIERQIVAAGLQQNVLLHGACAHATVLQHLRAADVAVLATSPTAKGKREGIPNVLKEAMALALPTVSTWSGGVPELVEHGVSGLLVQPFDAVALAGALEHLIHDPELRRRMGEAGRQRIVRDFDLRASTRRRASLFLNGAHGG